MILVVLLFAVLLAVDPMAFEQPPLKDGALLVLAPVLLIGAGASRLRRTFGEPLPGALLALSALLGWTVVLALVAPDRLPALREAARLLVFTALAKVTLDEATDRPRRLPLAMLAAGLLAALVALLQAAGLDLIFADLHGQAVSLFGNTNLTGEFLAPLAAFAFLAQANGPGALRALALPALPVLIGGLVVSQSRAALLASVVAMVVAPLLLAACGLPSARRGLLRGAALAGAGVLLAVACAGTAALGFKPIAAADASIASPEYPTNKQRLLLAEATLDMVADAPLTGHGPGRFRAAFPPYRDPAEAAIPTLGGAASEAEDPHNQYLLLLSEGGAVALALFLLFALLALLALRHAHLFPPGDDRRRLAPALAAGLIALLLLGLFRSLTEHAPSALLLCFMVGGLLACRGAPDGAPGRGVLQLAVPVIYLLLTFGVGVGVLGSNLCLAWAARSMGRALDAPGPGALADVMEGDAWLARGQRLEPDNIHLLATRARVLDLLARASPARAEWARAVRQATLTYYPFHDPALVGLAADALARDAVADARGYLRRLPHGPDLDDGAAVAAFLNRRRQPEAAALYLLAEARAGRISLSELPSRAEQAEAAGDLALARACRDAFLRARPFDPRVAYALGEQSTRAGDADAARRYYHRAKLGQALEDLQAGNYAAARRNAELAERHLEAPESRALMALADAASGQSQALDELARAGPLVLADDFVEALRERRNNLDLTSAIDALLAGRAP